MAKVCLISVDGNNVILPLRYMSSSLKKHNHDVRLICLPDNSDYEKYNLANPNPFLDTPYSKKILDQIVDKTKGFDLIGISSLAISKNRAIQVANKLKMLGIPIIWGGKYCTTCPEDAIKHVPIICVGDGEEAIKDLADSIDKKFIDYSIKNIWFNNGKIIRNPVRDCSNFNEMVLDYSFNEHYTLKNRKIVPMVEEHLTKRLIFQTMRGCPFRCSYCTNSVFLDLYKKDYFAIKDAENVISELIKIIKINKTIEWIWFIDDDFLLRDDIKKFCNLYMNHIKLPFKIYSSPHTITQEKLKNLTDAGLKEIDFGIQTASQQISDKLYNRSFSQDKIRKSIDIMHKFLKSKKLISVNLQFISNNPCEKEEDIISTIKFINTIPSSFDIRIFNLILFPGSNLQKRFVKEGIIENDHELGKFYYVDRRKFYDNNPNTYYNQILHCMYGKVSRLWKGSMPSYLINFFINKKSINIKKKIISFFFNLQLLWGAYSDINLEPEKIRMRVE